MKITIDTDKVAAKMIDLRANLQADGYTNCLVDELTDVYDLETAVTASMKVQGVDAEEFIEYNDEPIPGYACAVCGGDVTNERHQDNKTGALLCDFHYFKGFDPEELQD